MRKILTLLLLLVLVVTAVPALAFADDEPAATEVYTGEFRKITTDGTWEVNSVKPKTAGGSPPAVSYIKRSGGRFWKSVCRKFSLPAG